MSSSRTALNRITSTLILALTVGLLSCFPVIAGGNTPQAVSNQTSINLADYGAVGDGVADDGPALQSALDDLNALGGGTLQVPAGRYRLVTPVAEYFQSGLSATIQGVPSNTPIVVAGNGRGLDLQSEFVIASGAGNTAILLSGLDSLLMNDLGFVGVQEVNTDAHVVLALSTIAHATVRHCEFYGLASLAGGNIILSHFTNFSLEETAFLGCATNSGFNAPVIQNISWLGVSVRDSKFVDYGERPDFWGKTGFQPPYAWVMVGDPSAPQPSHSRREAVFQNVFLDEGGYFAIAVRPDFFSTAIVPFDVYMSQLYVNVNNLLSDGVYVHGAKRLFIDRSHFGWSTRAGFAITMLLVGEAVLDLIDCTNDATRLKTWGGERLTVINSTYTSLESDGLLTNVIETETPEEDPAQYVRQQYRAIVNRDPDPAGHFYWTSKILSCGGAASCVNDEQTALEAFLNASPAEVFSSFGQIIDDDGNPLPEVAVSLTGWQSIAMNTDSLGNFRFDRLPTAGEYEITPSKRHYVFEARSLETPTGDALTNFVGTLLRHSISGQVVTNSGTPIVGVTVVLSGGEDASTTTGPDGTYRFENLRAGGNYSVEVSRQNYTFNKASQSFQNLSNDETSDFTGTLVKYKISGVVKKPDGTPLVGASVELLNVSTLSQLTDATGQYSFEVNAEADYTLTIHHQPYFFEPPSQTFAFLSDNQRTDFQALDPVLISGRITSSKGIPLSGVSLSLIGSLGESTQTDIDGKYSISVRPHSDYTLTPSKLNYSFDPTSVNLANLSADQVCNFRGTPNPGVPVLVAASDPTRALALDAVLGTPEPFDFSYEYPWSQDRRTRLVLFVENIDLSGPESLGDVTVELVDSLQFIHPLNVEYAGMIDGADLTGQIVVRVNDNLTASGDYLIRVKFRGVPSQAVLVAFNIHP